MPSPTQSRWRWEENKYPARSWPSIVRSSGIFNVMCVLVQTQSWSMFFFCELFRYNAPFKNFTCTLWTSWFISFINPSSNREETFEFPVADENETKCSAIFYMDEEHDQKQIGDEQTYLLNLLKKGKPIYKGPWLERHIWWEFVDRVNTMFLASISVVTQVDPCIENMIKTVLISPHSLW